MTAFTFTEAEVAKAQAVLTACSPDYRELLARLVDAISAEQVGEWGQHLNEAIEAAEVALLNG